jgi:hypothetical protein
MPRTIYEFERGKGSMLDWQQESIVMYGPRSSFLNRKFKRGPFKHTSRREGVIYPLRWYRVVRKWDLYLMMRSRIGHGHFKGIRPKS